MMWLVVGGPVAHGFRLVVVEHQVRTRHVGGLVVMSRDVMATLPSLHVLGVDERDLVNQVQFIEQKRRTPGPSEVTAG